MTKNTLAAIMSLMILSAPLSAKADGFFGLFGGNKDGSSVQSGQETDDSPAIYNQQGTARENKPIFLQPNTGRNQQTSQQSRNQGAYNNYRSAGNDSGNNISQENLERKRRLEAEQKATLAAREAERQRAIEKHNAEHKSWLEALERKEQEEARRREAENANPETANIEGLRRPQSGVPSSATESTGTEEEAPTRRIYRKPSSNPDEPSRVFRDFR